MANGERALSIEKHRATTRPVVHELRAAGYEVDDIEGLTNGGRKYETAVGILVKWLPKIQHVGAKEEIVRALSVPWGKPALSALVAEFEAHDPPGPGALLWALGNALDVLADDSVYDRMVALARDSRYGASRQMLVCGLRRMKNPGTDAVLIELLSDADVNGHALEALVKRRAHVPPDVVSPFLTDERPWVRKNAGKLLSPGAKPTPRKKMH